MIRVRASLLGLTILMPLLGLAESPAPDSAGSRPAAAENAGAGGAPPKSGSADKSQETFGAKTAQEIPLPDQAVALADSRAAIAAAVAYLNAVNAGGFVAAPALLHPQALERFKKQVLPRLEQEQARGNRTLLNATFGREASLSTARSADPADFMTRCSRVLIARDPELALRFSSVAPLGAIREGERVHVLVRLGGTGAGGDEGRLEVVSLQRDGKTWKVLLDRRLEELAQALGGSERANDRRAPRARMEPMPEGVGPMPLGPPQVPPQGPPGRPPAPTSAAPSR
jgi:hypothetical protein